MKWELDAMKILAKNETIPGVVLRDAIAEIEKLRTRVGVIEAQSDAKHARVICELYSKLEDVVTKAEKFIYTIRMGDNFHAYPKMIELEAIIEESKRLLEDVKNG